MPVYWTLPIIWIQKWNKSLYNNSCKIVEMETEWIHVDGNGKIAFNQMIESNFNINGCVTIYSCIR